MNKQQQLGKCNVKALVSDSLNEGIAERLKLLYLLGACTVTLDLSSSSQPQWTSVHITESKHNAVKKNAPNIMKNWLKSLKPTADCLHIGTMGDTVYFHAYVIVKSYAASSATYECYIGVSHKDMKHRMIHNSLYDMKKIIDEKKKISLQSFQSIIVRFSKD